jgi:hypothetical protein
MSGSSESFAHSDEFIDGLGSGEGYVRYGGPAKAKLLASTAIL